jgi:hypothetical protein
MAKPARVVTTDAEIDAAIECARMYEKYDRKVVRATYSQKTDSLRLVFDDGAFYVVPRLLIQGLSNAEGKALECIEILDGGTGVLWPSLDVAHYVPAMLAGVYGSEKWMTGLHDRKEKLIENG